MAKVKKICRICGKEYTPCSYCEGDQMAFHYRTICCSRECAMEYFKRVMEAREKPVTTEAANDSTSEKENEVSVNTIDITTEEVLQAETSVTEKPKRKYTRKKVESENSEQIE